MPKQMKDSAPLKNPASGGKAGIFPAVFSAASGFWAVFLAALFSGAMPFHASALKTAEAAAKRPASSKPAAPNPDPPSNSAAAFNSAGEAEPYQIRLLSPFLKVKRGEPFPIGVFIQLDPGWHSYWSYAGDFGKAPKISWKLPKGVRIASRPFPRPERHAYALSAGKSHSFIYKKEFLLPFEAAAEKSLPEEEGPVKISADIEWFVCSDICVAKRSQASLELKTAAAFEADPAAQKIFQKHAARLPESLSLKSHFKRAGQRLLISFSFEEPLECADIFPKGAEHFAAAPPARLSQSEDSCLFEARSLPSRLSGISGLLVYKKNGSLKSALFQSYEKKPFGLAWFAFLAFLGGLILNIMPCVLPLIFIKFHNIMELSRLPRKRIFLLNFSYAAGVVLSFLALAVFILASKKAGESAGWGFHMQSPLFVSLLALVFVSMGFYLLKWIELPRPRLPAGFPLKRKDKKALPHFVTGALATTAASPCTVPFMAPALGFAFSRSAAETLIVFLFLGLGLSFPYLILSLFPQWLRYAPAPGKWTDILKSLLSIPLFLTALWLIWLLYLQLDFALFLLTACAFPLLGLLALSQRLLKSRRQKSAAALGLSLLIALLLSLQWAAGGPGARREIPPAADAAGKQKPAGPGKRLGWRPFSRSAVRADTAAGRRVFAAFGAAWCLTCKLNELIFNDEDVISFLKKTEVRMYYGDWTSRNPEITEFLDSYSQRGVPFYIFYSQSGEAFPLPTLLLKGRFLKTLSAAMDGKESL